MKLRIVCWDKLLPDGTADGYSEHPYSVGSFEESWKDTE